MKGYAVVKYREAVKHYNRREIPFNVWPTDPPYMKVVDLPELDLNEGRLFSMKSKFSWLEVKIGNSYYVKKGSEEVWEIESK